MFPACLRSMTGRSIVVAPRSTVPDGDRIRRRVEREEWVGVIRVREFR